jgi:hypothetical protein
MGKARKHSLVCRSYLSVELSVGWALPTLLIERDYFERLLLQHGIDPWALPNTEDYQE